MRFLRECRYFGMGGRPKISYVTWPKWKVWTHFGSGIVVTSAEASREAILIFLCASARSIRNSFENQSEIRFRGRKPKDDFETGFRTNLRQFSGSKMQCNQCEATFTRSDNLKRHARRCHSNDLFSCAICNKGLKNQEAMDRHLDFHQGKQKFQCDVCKKDYTSATGLKIHSRTHSDSGTRLKCSLCDKNYTTKQQLRQHVLAEHERLRFGCACGKVFKYQKNLTAHEATCGKNRQFLCRFCGKGLKTKVTLKKHEKLHEAVRQPKRKFICTVCGKTLNGSHTAKTRGQPR